MNNHQAAKQLRITIIDRILTAIDAPSSTDTLIELARACHTSPEIHHDIPLLQSAALLDFFAKQAQNGNRDVITPAIMQETFRYILEKLTPGQGYVL